MNRILVVEDDSMLNAGLCYNLELAGYIAVSAKNVILALAELQKNTFKLIILDVNLPDGDGFSLCKKIKQSSNVPVLFLTARDLEDDVINGFDLGADDYITKPFNINILLKKIAVILKRNNSPKSIYMSGALVIDFEKFIATIDHKNIVLTPTEYKILKILTANTDILLTRQIFLETLYDIDANFVDEHTLTVNINRLRNKIETKDMKYIKTVYGMGYIWTGGGYEK